MKGVVLLAVSFYPLKQDPVKATLAETLEKKTDTGVTAH
jgi:hypothetical protein